MGHFQKPDTPCLARAFKHTTPYQSLRQIQQPLRGMNPSLIPAFLIPAPPQAYASIQNADNVNHQHPPIQRPACTRSPLLTTSAAATQPPLNSSLHICSRPTKRTTVCRPENAPPHAGLYQQRTTVPQICSSKQNKLHAAKRAASRGWMACSCMTTSSGNGKRQPALQHKQAPVASVVIDMPKRHTQWCCC